MAASSPERMRRHSRKARHLLRVIRRSRHAAVQDMAVHELTHEIDHRHGRAGGTPVAHAPGPAGVWRPLTGRAKRLISQLRSTKVWRLQRQLVRELAEELRNGQRIIDRIRERAERAAGVVRRAAEITGRGARAIGRGARAMGRGARVAGARTAAAWRAVRNRSARGAGRPRIPAARRPVLRARPAVIARPARARTRIPRVRTARPRTRTR